MAYQGTYAGLAAQKSRGLAVLTPPSPPFRYSYPRDNTYSEVIGLLDNMMVWGRKTRQGRVSINEVGCLNMLVALFLYLSNFFSSLFHYLRVRGGCRRRALRSRQLKGVVD